MNLPSLSQKELSDFFSSAVLRKGKAYFEAGRVSDLAILECNEPLCVILEGKVQGSLRSPYETGMVLYFAPRQAKIPVHIESDCSCPQGFACKHASALLLSALNSQRGYAKNASDAYYDEVINQWIGDFERTPIGEGAEKQKFDPTYELHFFLNFLESRSAIPFCGIEPKLIRRLKSGKLGAHKNCEFSYQMPKKHLLPGEEKLIRQMMFSNQLASERMWHYRNRYRLSGQDDDTLIESILATGKCHIHDNVDAVLQLGNMIDLKPEWQTNSDGLQQLVLAQGLKRSDFFMGESLWYLNEKSLQIGKVNTNLSYESLCHLFTMPEIPPSYTSKLCAALAKNPEKNFIPHPEVLKPKDVLTCRPDFHIKLFMTTFRKKVVRDWQYVYEEVNTPVVELSFFYQEASVAWDNTAPILSAVQNKTVHKYARDFEVESQAVQTLQSYGLMPVSKIQEKIEVVSDEGDFFSFVNMEPLDFWNEALPMLRQGGWVVDVAEDYPFQLVEFDEDDWYANLEEESTTDWFAFELGIKVDDAQVNLLPVIHDILKDLKAKKETESLETRDFYAPLPDGRHVKLPGSRVKAIVNSMLELFDYDSMNEHDQLRIAKSQAARLVEIEKACGAARLRWFGSNKLQELGKKLSDFKGIVPVSPPESFKGTLRPYQQEGLNWLQFLRDHELGGILADDMGLGKTVQALSHILLEKESGRMTHPTLVIAPTSLMYNWEYEAKTFAPNLKTLVLHGSERKQYLDKLDEYDLILTTYQLIIRDKSSLLNQNFHLLILDEAQYIKNSKSLAAQIAIQLKAEHRLCLTGTPMENHLGELWSLFYFLMPGLLGDLKFFRRTFRTPIEKHADEDRRQALSRRVSPFMLRRTKDSVVKDLPQKIHMTRFVEFDKKQGDLYESIRIAMEEKVRKQVEQLGLARSHIVILDALLKLRQVCCDPRLLKHAQSNDGQPAPSAKMAYLKTLLPELIEEGRSILLFSQFTGMLKLIENVVDELNIPYVKLTGQTKDRKTPIESFQKGEVPLFLISLKAGGTGLNLTAADTVIHYDPWWNPAVENQATDRAHRIGQEKTVFVYKIVTKGTVEEKIIEMQNKKHSLAESLYTDKAASKSSLSSNDLKVLFSPLHQLND